MLIYEEVKQKILNAHTPKQMTDAIQPLLSLLPGPYEGEKKRFSTWLDTQQRLK